MSTEPMNTERAHVTLDGNMVCVLLGPNLQEGEAEFEPVHPDFTATTPACWYHKEIRAAFYRAIRRLEARLGKRLSYYYDINSFSGA